MKLGFYNDYRPALVREDGVVDISEAIPEIGEPQQRLQFIIENWDGLKSRFESTLSQDVAIPFSSARLRAPVPRPQTIIGMAGNYLEGLGLPPRAPRGFVIPPTAILDPEGTVVLPSLEFPICEHEAELVCVIGKSGKDLKQADAMSHVFGYTVGCDVSPRREDWRHIGKACDGFKPVGPYIVTADEVDDPHQLQIQLWVDGVLRQNYNTSDLGHDIPASLEWITGLLTLTVGDLVFMGVNHQGLGPIQDGETVEIEIDRIGRLKFNVSDPLKRTWPKEIDTDIAEHARNQIRKAAAEPPGKVKRPY